jgi:hypothetical protein
MIRLFRIHHAPVKHCAPLLAVGACSPLDGARWRGRWRWLRRLAMLLLAVSLLAAAPRRLAAQFPSTADRLQELEEKVKKLESKTKKQEEELDEAKAILDTKKSSGDKDFFSDGVFTIGGVKLKLGGKAEILFIDSQSEDDPVVGSTNEPDPHFELNRLQLSPVFILNREISVHAQIDFEPEEGRTFLKEMTARHKAAVSSWAESDLRLGLDDRFIRPARRTKNYPLPGNAFWRDESLALQWTWSFFGDREGKPYDSPDAKKAPEGAPDPSDSDVVLEDTERKPVKPEDGTGDEERARRFRTAEEREPGPFDFAVNRGELKVHASVGSGNALNGNEVGFDGAGFNDFVQDDRNVSDDLAIREVGLGIGYARSFQWLGELEVLGFYYNDELNDTSLEFLQDELTVRDPVTGVPVAGYGDSDSKKSYRYGVGAEYFLPASTYLGPDWNPRGGDGFRAQAQWIRGQDGKLRREGWYVQGSYRFSFPERLVADRYFRSIEPIVRFGELNVDLAPSPLLPGTWDRRQLLVGAFIEVTGEVIFKVEYTFNEERTGGRGAAPGPGDVRNNELLVELLLQF